MANEVIPYLEMCKREGVSLQRGMNFGVGGTYSVILMSRRQNAPYEDRIEADGTILIYEGHDELRSPGVKDPKHLDQPRFTLRGRLTQNGQFGCGNKGVGNSGRMPADAVLSRGYASLNVSRGSTAA
jgi:hypothetical protein